LGGRRVNSKSESKKLTEEEFLNLHKKYIETKDIVLRNKLILNFINIPKSVAVQLRGITAGYAQIEDMVNQGVIVLMDCLDRFDASKGIKFESYAFMRVRGGIIDLVRKQDWIPRRVRAKSKEIMNTYNELCNELMREPTQQELADRLNISVEKLSQYNSEIAHTVTLSFEDLIQNVNQMCEVLETSQNDDFYPEKNLLKAEMKGVLKEAIGSLTEKEKLVVTLYYYENLMFTDIAKVLDVSPQRISQIHTKAVLKLKSKMDVYMNELV
jgi:RNA polymerase sigma factor for flagellar operon FliA